MITNRLLKNLSTKGRKYYWPGQITLLSIYAFYYFFNLQPLGEHHISAPVIVALSIVLMWDLICFLLWPLDENTNNNLMIE